MSYLQAVILGAIQGITELFPISSLGHSVIIPSLFNWSINQGAESFLVFLVAVHLATALVLLIFFLKDWVLIVKGVFRSLFHFKIEPNDTYAKLGWLLIVGTVPAGILGLSFQNKVQELFASPKLVSAILILNGGLLYFAELLRKNRSSNPPPASRGTPITRGISTQESPINSALHSDTTISRLSWWQSIKIGAAQALALIPGFSRTGSALSGGLLVGLNHEDAARFAFLLATPIILAAGVLKLPLLFSHASTYPVGQTIAGAIAAAIGAYFSVKYLVKYFQTKTLKPFAAYCVIVGVLSLIVFVVR